MSQRVFITVAEMSGDRHAAQLIRSLHELDPGIVVEGHGGPEMAAAGAKIHFETVGRAAMGWRGALRAAEMWKVLRWTRKYFDQQRPDIQIGVDSPSLNFHFARIAHERGIPVMQYVAPQLWAWAEWRMKKLRKWVDQLACILPFEEEYFRRHGVSAQFVGHPLFDALPANRHEAQETKYPYRKPIVGLLPGSRKSEAVQHFPHLLEIAGRMREVFPDLKFLVPTTASTNPVVASMVGKWLAAHPDIDETCVDYREDAFDHLVPRCDLCLVVSGTATLHVAAFGVPFITMYRVNPFLWHTAARWLVKAKTRTLVNLLASRPDAGPQEHLVPEFTPWMGSNEPAAKQAIDFLQHPEKLAAQREKLLELVALLDQPGASMKTATIALEMMSRRASAIPEQNEDAVPELVTAKSPAT